MKQFLKAHSDKIKGILSCFDRVIFRGYLPIMSGWAMAQFLNQKDIRFHNLKSFLTEHAALIKRHAQEMAKRQGRPYSYLSQKIRMEDEARKIAKRDNIKEGLICIYSIVQPSRTFSFRFEKGRPFVQSAKRKCLYIYYYFMDREFGLIHVKIQTWFPLVMQVYVNGHEWLIRKLDREDIQFTKVDNVLCTVSDIERTQTFADRFPSLNWCGILDRYARKVNPFMDTLLHDQSYYWVTFQSEYSTDIMFTKPSELQELYPKLLSHSIQCFGAKEIMSFLGRKLVGQFQGEIISDLADLSHKRIPGMRIKHRVKQNWLKMYDKAGWVLRIEMVINKPDEFKVRKKVTRKGKK
jgi:hypothetical protein